MTQPSPIVRAANALYRELHEGDVPYVSWEALTFDVRARFIHMAQLVVRTYVIGDWE